MDAVNDIFVVWILAPLVMATISAIYFIASPNDESLSSRLAVSIHGAVGSLLFVGALFVALNGFARPAFREAYLVFWLCPVVLVIVSLLRFTGARRTHILLVPLGAAMLWAVIVGYTLVGGGK